MVRAAVLLASAALVIVTVGAALSSVSTTAAPVPILPRLSVTIATIELPPWIGSVTLHAEASVRLHRRRGQILPLSTSVMVWPATVAILFETTVRVMVWARPWCPGRAGDRHRRGHIASVSTTATLLPVLP